MTTNNVRNAYSIRPGCQEATRAIAEYLTQFPDNTTLTTLAEGLNYSIAQPRFNEQRWYPKRIYNFLDAHNFIPPDFEYSPSTPIPSAFVLAAIRDSLTLAASDTLASTNAPPSRQPPTTHPALPSSPSSHTQPHPFPVTNDAPIGHDKAIDVTPNNHPDAVFVLVDDYDS